MVALPPSGMYKIQDEVIWRICLKRLSKQMQHAWSKICSFSFLAASTLTKRNRSKWEQLWAPFPFPTRPWTSSSYSFPLLHVIYHWVPRNMLPLSLTSFLVISQMPAELLNSPRALVNSFRAPVLPQGRPWMMGLQVRYNGFLPHAFIKLSKGKSSHPPTTCSQGPL